MMDAELRVLLTLSRRLPKMRGAGRFANTLRAFYLRKQREEVTTTVEGHRMHLEPAECVDGMLLFAPQLYDFREIAFLRRSLPRGGTFLDLGAHIGFYSLVASRLIGPSGQVLAVEADPFNHARLVDNLRLNGAQNVRALQLGLADRREVLRLGINSTGNRSGNSFLVPEQEIGVEVQCDTLLSVIEQAGFHRVDGAKLDLEGFEHRVLSRFFADAPASLYPRFLILEDNPEFEGIVTESAVELALQAGYSLRQRSGLNCILERS